MSVKFKEELVSQPVLLTVAEPGPSSTSIALRAVEYEEFVCALAKDMGSDTLDILHAAVGISGEAGELLDAVKKHWAYGKSLDRVNVIEELGDLEFYSALLRQKIGVSRREVLKTNVSKLSTRYASMSYSDEAALARADKAGENNG